MSGESGTHLDRAFVAVVLPPAVLDAIDGRVGSSRTDDDGVRWSRREQWHLTLRFLGRVTDVYAVADAVRRACARTTAFEVQLGGSGAFRRIEQGTVLWVGVREGRGPLAQLAAAVETAVVGAGYEPEPRDFAPHLTLARTNRSRDFRRFVYALGDESVGPSWIVKECVLLSSDTRPNGIVYEERARFTLLST